MEININEIYRLISDKYNVILQEKKISEKDSEIRWENEGYYPDLEWAYRGCIKKGLHEGELKGVKEIVDYLKAIHEEIRQSVHSISSTNKKSKVKR